jgi:hypothetical protein
LAHLFVSTFDYVARFLNKDVAQGGNLALTVAGTAYQVRVRASEMRLPQGEASPQ